MKDILSAIFVAISLALLTYGLYLNNQKIAELEKERKTEIKVEIIAKSKIVAWSAKHPSVVVKLIRDSSRDEFLIVYKE